MNLDQFSTVVDDRRYINPQVALDESNAFIQNLRDTQQARNAEIAKDTYNLGTAVPSNIGGIGGSGSYFNARYQTPQTNTLVADLRSTAQAQALNDAMNNVVAQAKQRYNNAYRAYKKRHANDGYGGGNTGGTDPSDVLKQIFGDVEFEDNGPSGEEMTLQEVSPEDATGNALETMISTKEAELRAKKQTYDNTVKKTGIKGRDPGNFFNAWGGIFTDWSKLNTIPTQNRRIDEIRALESEIEKLKSQRGK